MLILIPGPCMCCRPLQALNLFRRKTGRTEHFHIKLDKHVPHGEAFGSAVLLVGVVVFCLFDQALFASMFAPLWVKPCFEHTRGRLS
jgi:hypothetical protein